MALVNEQRPDLTAMTPVRSSVKNVTKSWTPKTGEIEVWFHSILSLIDFVQIQP
jgi:hypothetical protein